MNKRILIAEDEASIAALYQEYLEMYGYDSIVCKDCVLIAA